MRLDERMMALRTEASRIESALIDAVPERSSWAAIVMAFGNLTRHFAAGWAVNSAKRWKRPTTKEAANE